jgi:hypothetical protein
MAAATVSSIPLPSAHHLLFFSFHIRRHGSHIHGAQYVDRWTAIVANAFRFKCYRRVRPFTVGERWGNSKRPEETSYKPSSLCRDRPSSIPSLLGAVFPHGRPSGLGAFPAIAGQRSEVWWQPPDCRVVPLPLPRPREPSPNRNLQRPHLIRFKTSDLFAFYVIFDETTCPALSISQHSDGVRVLPVCTVQ